MIDAAGISSELRRLNELVNTDMGTNSSVEFHIFCRTHALTIASALEESERYRADSRTLDTQAQLFGDKIDALESRLAEAEALLLNLISTLNRHPIEVAMEMIDEYFASAEKSRTL